MREYRPKSPLMTNGIVPRRLSGPVRPKRGWEAFDEDMDARPENNKKGGHPRTKVADSTGKETQCHICNKLLEEIGIPTQGRRSRGV